MGDSNRQKLDTEVIDGVAAAAMGELQGLEDEVEKMIDEFETEQAKLMWGLEKKKAPVLLKRKEAIAKIPNFWAMALSHHPQFAELIEGEDEDLLNYLIDVLVEQNGGDLMTHAKITFTFKANPYFENKELIREYKFVNEELTLVPVPEINWKKGKRLTGVKESKNKKRTHEEISDSFFNWFDPSVGFPEELVKNLGVSFIEDLWPNAFKYFKGEAPVDEELAFGEDEDDLEGGEGEEEEEAEEDDE